MKFNRAIQRASRQNAVRINAGVWRGRSIRFPDAPGLRPTPDRVRETLFNWLGQDLSGHVCLDLFAGSGALGFEALSRNATRVVFVEPAVAVAAAIAGNAERLGASAATWRIERRDALEVLRTSGERFNVVFCDPPFHAGWLERVFAALPPRLAPGARVYLESESPLHAASGWTILKSARAGAVYYGLAAPDKEEQG